MPGIVCHVMTVLETATMEFWGFNVHFRASILGYGIYTMVVER